MHVLSYRNAAAAVLAAAALLLGTVAAAPAASAAVPTAAPVLVAPALDEVLSKNPLFQWNSVSGATSYRLQYSTSASFSPVTTIDTVNTNATVLDKDIANGNYYWRVYAANASGVGPWSDTGTFTKSPSGAPSVVAPADGTTFAYPAETPILQWQPMPGVATYKVEIADEPTFTTPTVLTTANTSYAVTGSPLITLGTTWYWRVYGTTKDARDTQKSTPRTFSVSWPGGKPSLTSPPNSSVTPISDIVLRWAAVDGAKSYNLQVSLSPVFSGPDVALISSVVGTQYSPSITWLNDNYYWRVSAVDTLGRQGPWSDTRTFTRDAAAPDRPTLNSPSDGASVNEWRFTWSSVPNASAYELQYSTSNAFTTSSGCTTFHTDFSGYNPLQSGWTYPDPPVGATANCLPPSNGTYFWRVRAIDAPPAGGTAGQAGPWSVTQSVTYTSPSASVSVPAQLAAGDYTSPTTCEAPACSTSLGDTPELSWAPVANAASYKVWIANDRKFTSGVRTYTTRGTHLRVRDSLPDNATDKSYYWWVQPCGGTNLVTLTNCAADDQTLKESVARAFRKLAPTVQLLTPADGATVTDVVPFTWQNLYQADADVSGAAGYRIQVSKDPTFSTSQDLDSGAAVVGRDSARVDQTSYAAWSKLYPPGTYYWRVQGLDGDQAQEANLTAANMIGMPWSTVRSFTVASSTPTDLTATKPDPSSALPVLTWTSTPYVSGYLVQIYNGTSPLFDGGVALELKSPGSKLPSFAPTTGLVAGTYSWRVARIDASGNPGPFVPAASLDAVVPTFTVAAPAASLTSPSNGAILGGNSLLFTWSEVPGAATYQFEVTGPTGPNSTTTNSSVLTGAFAPTTAYKDGSFTWKVKAKDGAGNIISTSATGTFTHDGTGPTASIDVSAGPVGLRPSLPVTFSEPTFGITSSTVRLTKTGSVAVAASLVCSDAIATVVPCSGGDIKKVVVKPSADVVPGETYTVNVSAGLTDVLGNAGLATTKVFRAITAVEQNSASVKYVGTWTTVTTSAASGGSYKKATATTASASWTFRGSSARVSYVASKAAGKAKIYVDGVLRLTLDMYSSSTVKKTYALSLPVGGHTVKVVPSGTKGGVSTSTAINVDGFSTT